MAGEMRGSGRGEAVPRRRRPSPRPEQARSGSVMRVAPSRTLQALASVLLGAGTVASAGTQAATLPAWVFDEGGVLELLLAHEEPGGDPDVGVLRVDPHRRRLSWEGIGEQACPRVAEVAFEEVRAVKQRRGAGFVVELRGEQARSLVLIPLPDGTWLRPQYTLVPGRLDNFLESSDVFAGRGEARSTRAPGASAPNFTPAEAPAAVVASSREAVDRLLAALGRAPDPAVALRGVLYGRPLDAFVDEVAAEPGRFVGRSVHLRGRLEPGSGPTSHRLVGVATSLPVIPEREIAALVRAEAAGAAGQEVEITGVCQLDSDGVLGVRFWEWSGVESTARAVTTAPLITLEALSAAGGEADGKLVRVRGQFRGSNRRGDLPLDSRRDAQDWVLKDGRHAVWVAGRRPEGRGWVLEAGDEGQWLEVVARPRSRDGVTWLHASTVTVIPRPDGAHVLPARRQVVTGDVPPAVVFTLPLAGERVAPDAGFAVQFSKYMDEESFAGRVHLWSIGPTGEDPREVPCRASWDEGRRALVVQPISALARGRSVELRLARGILDAHGMPLPAAPEGDPEGPAVVIRYQVE